jgi:hypothetical protein
MNISSFSRGIPTSVGNGIISNSLLKATNNLHFQNKIKKTNNLVWFDYEHTSRFYIHMIKPVKQDFDRCYYIEAKLKTIFYKYFNSNEISEEIMEIIRKRLNNEIEFKGIQVIGNIGYVPEKNILEQVIELFFQNTQKFIKKFKKTCVQLISIFS